MIEALNNRMLFGALSNLRLAPHVREGREGREVAGGQGVRAHNAYDAPASAETTSTTSTAAIGTKVQLRGEKVSISANAMAALRERSPAQNPDQLEDLEHPAGAGSAPTPALNAALATAAYQDGFSGNPARATSTSSLLGIVHA